ncbi:glycosyltransferase [Actinomadura sp. WMMA1423]|uniref:glycosyltransferase n=1 Tax=Actinomadura sp. WMMA1423 TaxID=2591108 RepID=UPI001146E2A8|nr:glycosyltransferase [Actinomadura sp. WMMA1423]
MVGERIRVMRVIARMNVGGPAVQVATLMRGLDPERFEQRLYCGHVGEDEADYTEMCAPDIEPHHVPTLGRAVRPGGDVRSLAHLAAAMRGFRPHIVHTHTAKAGALGRVAAVAARVPARVHTFHGHLLHGYFPPAKTRLLIGAERAFARLSHRLVAVGPQVRDDLLAAGIGRPEQYVVAAPGLALAPLPERRKARHELGLPESGPVVAYVGRVTGIKRPDRLLEVMEAVRRDVPAVRFAVCGGGDLAGEFAARAARLDGAVRMLGWRADVETVYAAADLVLLTSDNEGTPVSLIEGGMAGLPAVATRVGGVASVVEHGVTGLLAPPRADELAHRVLELLRDDHLRLSMGERARARTTERFGPGRLVGDMEALYSALAAERGRSAAGEGGR